MKQCTIYEALQWASSFLQEHGREETSARFLMEYLLNTNYSGLMMKMHDSLTEQQLEQFKQFVKMHASGKPIQYITGEEQFYGRTFKVNESVLIPRPETEELILYAKERISEHLQRTNAIKLCDIGTGSGAIAITMKLECPEIDVTATDISEEALETAKTNAQNLGAVIDFRLGNLTAPIEHEKWDIVLSNPPYIAFDEAKEMSDVVLEHEPHTALFAEENGLALYRKLAENLPNLLNDRALIGLEIGYSQGEAVVEFFKKSFPHASIEIIKDINNKDRFVFVKLG